MKTLNKKILTACLALMMAVAMALPTFATQPDVPTTFQYAYYYVGTSGAFNNASVYYTSDATEGTWYLRRGTDGLYRLYTGYSYTPGSGYVMNRHLNNVSCILWRDYTDAASVRDSVVDLLTSSPGKQRISLERATGNKYLNMDSGMAVWSTFGLHYTVEPW